MRDMARSPLKSFCVPDTLLIKDCIFRANSSATRIKRNSRVELDEIDTNASIATHFSVVRMARNARFRTRDFSNAW